MSAEHLEALMKAGGFTSEQLAENRAGRLHPTQQQRGGGMGCAVFFFIVAALVAAGGAGGALAYYDMARKPLERLDENALYFIGIGTAVVSLAAFWFARGLVRDAHKTRAELATGECHFWDITFQLDPLKQQFGDFFYVYRGDERAQIPRDVARLMKNGGKYRLYFGAGSLISLEPLG